MYWYEKVHIENSQIYLSTLCLIFLKTLNQNPTNDGDGETVLPGIDENLVNNLNLEINGHITSEEIQFEK